jgi:PAS domain S-box-containing protein
MTEGTSHDPAAALRASEARYRAVVEDQTETINRLKPDGTLTFVNEVFCRFFGCRREQVLGKTWHPMAVPEDLPAIEAQLRSLSPTHPVVVIENRVYSGAGKIHWMQFVNRGFFDAQNQLLEIQCVGRDITERKLAEQRLNEALELNRTLIAASTVGIAAFTADGQCVLVNEAHARIVGGSMLGLNLFQLDSWRRQGLTEAVTEVLGNRQPRQLEFRGRTAFNKEICVHIHFTTFVSNGKLHLLMLMSDITERFRLEREILEISDREQARIGQDLHDGLCQQLVSLAFDANGLQQRLTQARRPEAKVAGRIADLLDAAITESRQVSRGLFPIRLEAGSLAPALEELSRTTRERFGVECDFECDEEATVKDKVLATHLYRIAQEAVTNAARHGQPRHIHLRLLMQEGGLELSIADDGLGLGETAAPGRHPGMGLHIMEYRARSIGGTLRLAAATPSGTVVTCSLPRGTTNWCYSI